MQAEKTLQSGDTVKDQEQNHIQNDMVGCWGSMIGCWIVDRKSEKDLGLVTVFPAVCGMQLAVKNTTCPGLHCKVSCYVW